MRGKKDRVFAKPVKKQFEFDEEVASVFDDMISRSVPFYREVLDLVSDLVVKNTQEGDYVFDLGCSTATTLLEVFRKSPHALRLIGIDSSKAMIERSERKARAYGAPIELLKADILEYTLPACQVVLSNYTLQFVRPLKREELVKKIYEALRPGGIFLFSEKVISEDKILDKQLIEEYYAFKKKQGYSELEIVQKREALENVLVPYSEEENRQMVKRCGFSHVETIFRWANFATFFARR